MDSGNVYVNQFILQILFANYPLLICRCNTNIVIELWISYYALSFILLTVVIMEY